MDKRLIKDEMLMRSFTETGEGLILTGYEMFYGVVNGNGERYEVGAFDNFIEEYFVKNKLNMPVTVQHGDRLEDIVGRVLEIETDERGFSFKVLVSNKLPKFSIVKTMVEEGMLQGFSKEGWATDYWFNKDGIMEIKEMWVTAVSLVTTPANGLHFKEVSNDLKFTKKKNTKDTFDELFNC